MNQTMAILVATTVLMATGVAVLVTFSGSVDGFQSDAESLEGQGCDYQQRRALENPDLTDQLSSRCNTDEFEQRQQERSVVEETISQLTQ